MKQRASTKSVKQLSVIQCLTPLKCLHFLLLYNKLHSIQNSSSTKKKNICLYKKMNWFFFWIKSHVLEMSLFPKPFLHCALCTFQLLCVKLHSCSYCSWKPNNASITKKYKGKNLLIGLCFCRFSRSQVTQS